MSPVGPYGPHMEIRGSCAIWVFPDGRFRQPRSEFTCFADVCVPPRHRSFPNPPESRVARIVAAGPIQHPTAPADLHGSG